MLPENYIQLLRKVSLLIKPSNSTAFIQNYIANVACNLSFLYHTFISGKHTYMEGIASTVESDIDCATDISLVKSVRDFNVM